MPALKNPKHQLFARELARGTHYADAHEQVGYASNVSNAWSLKNKNHIQRRLSELLDQRTAKELASNERAIERLAITKESVLGELAKVAFANMQDYMIVGEDGQPTLNFKDLTRDQAAALCEITVEEFKDGRSDKREVRRVKFKLAPKLDALISLGKHMGLFIERHEHGGVGDFARMTEQELDQTLRDHAGALGLPDEAIAGL